MNPGRGPEPQDFLLLLLLLPPPPPLLLLLPDQLLPGLGSIVADATCRSIQHVAKSNGTRLSRFLPLIRLKQCSRQGSFHCCSLHCRLFSYDVVSSDIKVRLYRVFHVCLTDNTALTSDCNTLQPAGKLSARMTTFGLESKVYDAFLSMHAQSAI